MRDSSTDMRNPLKVTKDPWIRIYNPEPKERTSYVGKWLLFISPDNVLEVWSAIREATITGSLGIQAKVATAEQGIGRSVLICVYTYDCRNMEDVRRVLSALREMGFTHRLNYKEDNATYANVYGSGASLFTSPTGTLIKMMRSVIEPPEWGTIDA